MSDNQYYYRDITGLGHGFDWGAGHPFDPRTRSYFPPGYPRYGPRMGSSFSTLASTPASSIYSRSQTMDTPTSISGMSSYAGSRFGGSVLNGGAAMFRPGQSSHYYHDIRGEWEDDDF